ncbi:hypothetical protein VTI28DRAFT_9420 [Corynascus sepedonium]
MSRHNNIPTILAKPTETSPKTSLFSVPYRKMHRRLMHASKTVVEEACKRAGIVLTAKEDFFCEGCVMGKATDQLGKEAPVQGNWPFDIVRMDLVTHKNPGHLGYRYSIHIIDVWTNYHWVKFIRTKGDAFSAVRDWIEMIYTQTSQRVKMIGIDAPSMLTHAPKASSFYAHQHTLPG